MRTQPLVAWVLGLLLAGSFYAGDAVAQKPKRKNKNETACAQALEAGQSQPQHCQRPRLRHSSSGAETPAQRERRLRQECKNLVNAGACQGYGYGARPTAKPSAK